MSTTKTPRRADDTDTNRWRVLPGGGSIKRVWVYRGAHFTLGECNPLAPSFYHPEALAAAQVAIFPDWVCIENLQEAKP